MDEIGVTRACGLAGKIDGLGGIVDGWRQCEMDILLINQPDDSGTGITGHTLEKKGEGYFSRIFCIPARNCGRTTVIVFHTSS